MPEIPLKSSTSLWNPEGVGSGASKPKISPDPAPRRPGFISMDPQLVRVVPLDEVRAWILGLNPEIVPFWNPDGIGAGSLGRVGFVCVFRACCVFPDKIHFLGALEDGCVNPGIFWDEAEPNPCIPTERRGCSLSSIPGSRFEVISWNVNTFPWKTMVFQRKFWFPGQS